MLHLFQPLKIQKCGDGMLPLSKMRKCANYLYR